jgi:phosphotransferase system HPr (HPr) family protein
MHARPVMRFVDVASRFGADVWVSNVSRGGRRLNGKSAMELMLLEATQGTLLRIEAEGVDSPAAVETLARLVLGGFQPPTHTDGRSEEPSARNEA